MLTVGDTRISRCPLCYCKVAGGLRISRTKKGKVANANQMPTKMNRKRSYTYTNLGTVS